MTYVTVAEADSYLVWDEGWSTLTVEERTRAVSAAIDALDFKPWVGSVVSETQENAWPRKAFSYYDPAFGVYVTLEEGVIPPRLRKAVCKLALHFSKYPTAISAYEPTFDSISIGPISLSNTNPDSERKVPRVPLEVEELLLPFLAPNYSTPTWWRAN